MQSYSLLSILGPRDLFHEDARVRVPTGERVSTPFTATIAHPESHANPAFWDILTVTLDVSVAMEVFVRSCSHVHNSINRQGAATLGAVECEVPPFTAIIAAVDPKTPVPVDV